MIYFLLYGSNSDSEPTSDSEAFTSATSDYFERQSIVLCQGILWKSHHFLVYFFIFSLSFFVFVLEWLSWGYPYFYCGLGLPLPWSRWISVSTHLFQLAQNNFLAILTIYCFLAVFNFRGHFEGLNVVFWGLNFSMISKGSDWSP